MSRKTYPYHTQDSTRSNTVYANLAEMFSSQLDDTYDTYYDPYYYDNGPWYLNSGALGHVAADAQKLDYPYTSSGVEISENKTGGGESHAIHGTSSATMNTSDGAIKLKLVKYVHSMTKNLVFVGAIADSSCKVVFSSSQCWITDQQGKLVALGKRDPQNGLYCFQDQIAAISSYSCETTNLQEMTTWTLKLSKPLPYVPNSSCSRTVQAHS